MNNELGPVLKLYNLTDCIINPTNTRSYNKHYEVIGQQCHYDLRFNRKPLSYENLLYECQVLDFLNQSMEGIVPKIILANNDKVCVEYNNHFYTLFAWLANGPKVVQQVYGESEIKCAGKELAKLHKKLKNFKPSAKRDDNIVYATINHWSEKFFPIFINEIIPLTTQGDILKELVVELNHRINGMDFSLLPLGINHGDFKPCNVLFEQGRVKTIFDFDCAHEDYLLNDLVCAILSFTKMHRLPSYEFITLQIFLAAYNKERTLSDVEIKSLSTFLLWKLIKDIAVFFEYNAHWWDEISRVVDRVFYDIKDYEKFEKKVQLTLM